MTNAEAGALTLLAASNYPIHEGYVSHKCMYGPVHAAIDRLQKEQNSGTSFNILKADSVLKYIAYCDDSIRKAAGLIFQAGLSAYYIMGWLQEYFTF